MTNAPEIITLENGVRVVVDPMPGLQSASIGVWARAGAIDEETEEHGVAHLLEHMAFKGTTTRSARAIAEEIENVGGYLNASTGYSRTGYYARVLKPDVVTAIDILADILTNPVFDADELAKEHEVVIQEIGEAADIPDDAVMEMLQALSYGAHPLGRPILGTVDSVLSHTPGRLSAFMGKHYAPAEMIVAASGAIDPDEIVALARSKFGDRRPSPKPPRALKPRYAGGARHDAREIEQTHIALALPGAAVRDDDYFATRVFVEALGGGMSSRIFQAVREERGLAYSVYAFVDAYEDVGCVGAYIGTDRENAAEAVGLVMREVADMATRPTAAEIARSRAMLKSTLLMGLESPATRSEAAVGQLFTHGRIITSDEIAARIDAVSLDDIRRVAAKAASGRPSLAVVGPAAFGAIEAALAH